jgi:ParB-like chromosome segregation protein Spo0J
MAKEKNTSETGFITLPIEKLVAAQWNYKTDDEEKENKLLANIKRNGQLENIIVRELETGFFEVVNGNHRLTVFEKLEYPSVHCFNLGKISVAAAERIAVETNETRFPTDSVKLASVLREIIDEFGLKNAEETLPFNEAELNAFNKLLDFDPEQFSGSEGFPNNLPKIVIETSEENFPELKNEIERIAIQFPGTIIK